MLLTYLDQLSTRSLKKISHVTYCIKDHENYCIFQIAYGTGSQWASEDEVHWTFNEGGPTTLFRCS